MNIPGGYYLKARKIQESAIAHAPPHVREIWDWLLMQANHSDNSTCKRGQCYRTYKDIQEGLSWFIGYRKMSYKKHQCETAMKWLKKATMVTATKTTRGMLVTICNYDRYQTPENYENHSERHTITTMEPQPTDTINKNDKNVKNEKKKEKEHELSHFDIFWSAYPKKKNKEDARKAWNVLNRNGDRPEISILVAAINTQKQTMDWQKESGQYIPYPGRWLRAGAWTDEIKTNRMDGVVSDITKKSIANLQDW